MAAPRTILRYAAALAAVDDVSPDAVLIKHGLIGEERVLPVPSRRSWDCRLPGFRGSGAERISPNSILAGLAPLAPPMRGWASRRPKGSGLQRILAMRGQRPVQISWSRRRPACGRPSCAGRCRPSRAEPRTSSPSRAPHLSTRDSGSGAQLALLAPQPASLSFWAGLAPNLAMAVAASLLAPTSRWWDCGSPRRRSTIRRSRVTRPRGLPRRRFRSTRSSSPSTRRPAWWRVWLGAEPARLPAREARHQIRDRGGRSATAQALATHALPGFMDIIVAPAGLPRTKPRALNIALPLARGAFTVGLRRGGRAR